MALHLPLVVTSDQCRRPWAETTMQWCSSLRPRPHHQAPPPCCYHHDIIGQCENWTLNTWRCWTSDWCCNFPPGFLPSPPSKSGYLVPYVSSKTRHSMLTFDLWTFSIRSFFCFFLWLRHCAFYTGLNRNPGLWGWCFFFPLLLFFLLFKCCIGEKKYFGVFFCLFFGFFACWDLLLGSQKLASRSCSQTISFHLRPSGVEVWAWNGSFKFQTLNI